MTTTSTATTTMTTTTHAADRAMPAALRARFTEQRACDVTDALRIEPGSMRDFTALARFHYRSGRPGASTQVYRLVAPAPARTVRRSLGRRAGAAEIVGVLVRSLPPLCCRLRDLATGGRYRDLAPGDAARALNREVRTISRVVIDPRWRGLGLAVRLVRHALDQAETPYTEALAVMGQVHPFFERAGMIRYDAPPRAEDERLRAALARAGIDPVTLVSSRLARQRIDGLAEAQRAALLAELRWWHRRSVVSTRRSARPVALDALLHAARTRLGPPPVYYLAHHPDLDGRNQ